MTESICIMSFNLHAEPIVSGDISADTTTKSFDSLGLAAEIVRSIGHAGYPSPTEVQARTVPQALAGHDLMVSSQTGSGKTAAFVWPALQRILDARNDPAKRRAKGQACGPRVLVLAPTRELAMQVSRAFSVYGHSVAGLRVAHVVGGVPYHAQLKALRGPLDILIATPGRLLDLMGSGSAIVGQVELLVLDEADRMLDMGFIDDITTIANALPTQRQTMMFSATFAGNVGQLARQLTKEPQRISVDSHTDTHASIEQRLHWADSLHHKHALLEQLLAGREVDQALVFTSTQRDADDLAHKLAEIGHSVAALHGGLPQGRRNRVLQGLRSRQLRVLVATDVAARGIDVPTISHVINYGLPMKAEDYVHRIGRTGRAGRTGLAITLAERRDVGMIRRIERFTTQPITTAVLPGLEPKLPEPSATRPAFAGRGRPSFADRGNDRGNGRGNDRGPHRGSPAGHGGAHAGAQGGANGGGYAGGHHGERNFSDRNAGNGGNGGNFGHGGQAGFRGGDNRAAGAPFERGPGAGARPPARGFAGKPAFGPRRTPR